MLTRRSVLRAAACLPLAACLTARPTTPHFAGCQALLDRYVAERRIAGAVLGIVRGRASPVFLSAGSVALDTDQPATPDSICRIYSMTKPITGVATLICIADGLLALDQPLADIAPEFADMRVLADPQSMETRPTHTAITIRHLLTHTAGFTYHINGDGPLQRLYRESGLFGQGRAYWPQPGDGPAPTGLDEFAARLAALPLASEPGARWEYSVSFDILGLVIERAAQMPFGLFLKRRLFQPLGMEDTAFFVPAEKVELTSNYLVTADGLQRIDDRAASPFAVEKGVAYGGAGLVSTARDYAAFCRMLLGEGVVGNRRIAPREAVRRAGRNLLPPAVVTTGTVLGGAAFGAGMWIMTGASAKPGEEPPGAYGWSGASGTTMLVDPVNAAALVLMTQYYPATAYPLASETRRCLYADLCAIRYTGLRGMNRGSRE